MIILGNINTYILDMPWGLRGCACENADGGYTILINGKLSYYQQVKTYQHELGHITNNDFEKYDIGVIERRQS